MDLQYESLSNIDLTDEFFNTLREDYKGFDNWFRLKSEAGERAYVLRKMSGDIQGFLYLKIENEESSDIVPVLPKARRVKVGTLNINAHGTRLGQRFIKKMLDWAVVQDAGELYVTVFEKHEPLIKLLVRYGFVKWGVKNSESGQESVYLKKIGRVVGEVEKDYPVLDASNNIFLLAIYPKFHTKLFPDSILNTEAPDIIKDVSSSNSIHKIFLSNIDGVEDLRAGDVLIIYRTAEGGAAEYTAVATSLCVVEEIRSIHEFHNEQDFLSYASPYSVFSDAELKGLWKTKRYPKIVRFTYNVSLAKRPNRKMLIEQVGIDRNAYAGFMRLTPRQLKEICKLGKINEGLIINQA